MSALTARKAKRQKQYADQRKAKASKASTCTPESINPPERLLTIRVPCKLTTRGGRKLVVGPAGQELAPPLTKIDSAIVKALARAFRWRKLIETGVYNGVDHIARAEKINSSYVSRIIRLTLLAPDIVEAILGAQQPGGLQIDALRNPLPLEWERQRNVVGFIT